jgi:hypothetical protein
MPVPIVTPDTSYGNLEKVNQEVVHRAESKQRRKKCIGARKDSAKMVVGLDVQIGKSQTS